MALEQIHKNQICSIITETLQQHSLLSCQLKLVYFGKTICCNELKVKKLSGKQANKKT